MDWYATVCHRVQSMKFASLDAHTCEHIPNILTFSTLLIFSRGLKQHFKIVKNQLAFEILLLKFRCINIGLSPKTLIRNGLHGFSCNHFPRNVIAVKLYVTTWILLVSALHVYSLIPMIRRQTFMSFFVLDNC